MMMIEEQNEVTKIEELQEQINTLQEKLNNNNITNMQNKLNALETKHQNNNDASNLVHQYEQEKANKAQEIEQTRLINEKANTLAELITVHAKLNSSTDLSKYDSNQDIKQEIAIKEILEESLGRVLEEDEVTLVKTQNINDKSSRLYQLYQDAKQNISNNNFIELNGNATSNLTQQELKNICTQLGAADDFFATKKSNNTNYLINKIKATIQ